MIFNKFKRNDVPELDPKLAGQMLQNVFDVCETESNQVPLEDLMSYANYRKERFSLQKILLIVIMILFCMLPMLFIAPSFTVKEQGDGVYKVQVHTVLPVSYVNASIGEHNMPVYEQGAKEYSIEPTDNGTMVVEVGLFNRQYAARKVNVGNVDTTPPTIVSDYIENGDVYLRLSDDSSGVQYDAIYAMDAKGGQHAPAFYDEEEGYVAFHYPSESINVFIPDKAGNTLQVILNIQ